MILTFQVKYDDKRYSDKTLSIDTKFDDETRDVMYEAFEQFLYVLGYGDIELEGESRSEREFKNNAFD
jgi:hypothetical protein